MITASRTALATHCAWWARPDVTLPRTESSAAAALGTEVHAAIEATIKGDVWALSAEGDAIYQAWLDGWWARFSCYRWRSEVAYELAPLDGKARETGAHGRDYSRDPARISGTADAVFINGRTGWLVDFKTGREAPPARDNAQLLTLACAMRLAHNLDAVRAAIVHVRPDGVRVDEVTLDEFDLDSWLDTLGDLVRALPTAEAKPGPHCRSLYCAALGICPATSHALAEVQPHRLRVVTSARDIESPEHASSLYGLVRLAEARVKAIKSALAEYADAHGGVPVGEGRTWQRVDRHREVLDLSTPGALTALRIALGEYADDAIEHSVTKAAIEHAARKIARETNRPIKHVVLDVMNALRDVGAARPTKSTSYEERESR